VWTPGVSVRRTGRSTGGTAFSRTPRRGYPGRSGTTSVTAGAAARLDIDIAEGNVGVELAEALSGPAGKSQANASSRSSLGERVGGLYAANSSSAEPVRGEDDALRNAAVLVVGDGEDFGRIAAALGMRARGSALPLIACARVGVIRLAKAAPPIPPLVGAVAEEGGGGVERQANGHVAAIPSRRGTGVPPPSSNSRRRRLQGGVDSKRRDRSQVSAEGTSARREGGGGNHACPAGDGVSDCMTDGSGPDSRSRTLNPASPLRRHRDRGTTVRGRPPHIRVQVPRHHPAAGPPLAGSVPLTGQATATTVLPVLDQRPGRCLFFFFNPPSPTTNAGRRAAEAELEGSADTSPNPVPRSVSVPSSMQERRNAQSLDRGGPPGTTAVTFSTPTLVRAGRAAADETTGRGDRP